MSKLHTFEATFELKGRLWRTYLETVGVGHFLRYSVDSVVSSIDLESRNTLQHLLIAASVIPKRRDCFNELPNFTEQPTHQTIISVCRHVLPFSQCAQGYCIQTCGLPVVVGGQNGCEFNAMFSDRVHNLLRGKEINYNPYS